MMKLDTNSQDAMHWAECLVDTAKTNKFTLEQVLDESWLVGWFANYWAAIHDPMATERDQLRAELTAAKKKSCDVCVWKDAGALIENNAELREQLGAANELAIVETKQADFWREKTAAALKQVAELEEKVANPPKYRLG